MHSTDEIHVLVHLDKTLTLANNQNAKQILVRVATGLFTKSSQNKPEARVLP